MLIHNINNINLNEILRNFNNINFFEYFKLKLLVISLI